VDNGSEFLRRVSQRVSTCAEEQRLLLRVLESPEDAAARQDYINWLNWTGDIRYEYLVTLHYVWTRGLHDFGDRHESNRRLNELRAVVDPLWRSLLLHEPVPVPGVVKRVEGEECVIDLGGGLEGQLPLSELSDAES
jgi:hypothetical protein